MTELHRGPFATGTEPTSFESDGFTVAATLAWPIDQPVVSGLVLHPDIMGARPLFDDLAERLASHGLAVITIEPWFTWSAAHRSERATAPDRLSQVQHLDDAIQLRALALAAHELRRRHPGCPVDLLGFCMGGMYTLKAAATGHFRQHVAFYGMVTVPEGWRGPGQGEPLATLVQAGPTLAIFGGVDHWSPPADIEALRHAWIGRDDCEIVVYPEADHAFVHDPQRATHRPEDADDAWKRALGILGVGPSGS